MFDPIKVVEDRIKRLKKFEKEYGGRDYGFYRSLIESQEKVLFELRMEKNTRLT